MVSEWRQETLDQLGRIVTGKTPPSSHPEYFAGEVPFVTPTDLDGRRIIETTGRYLTELGADSVAARIPAGAVMVSCIGSDMGKAAIAGCDCVTNQQINSIIVDGPNDLLFVYYNLSTRKEEIRNMAGGSAQPILNKSAFGRLDILLPPPAEQRAIARILGALDGRIELNRKMNATLEAIAQAIFKSWFVDFDPVRAKMEGKEPVGMDAETAALFPDALEVVDGQEVPEGWIIATIGDFVSIVKGKSYKSAELQDSDKALVTLKSFRRGGGYREDGLKPYVGNFKPEQVVVPGELIVAFTDVTQEAEVIGRPAIVSANPAFNILIASLDVGIIRPRSDSIGTPYLYNLFMSEGFQAHITGYTSGTTVLHLAKDGIPSYQFVKPNDSILNKYQEIAGPIYSHIEQNMQQSRTLATIRDILLPKLISGEIRVPDAMLEAAEG